MDILASAPAGGNLGPFALRTEAPPEQPPPHPAEPGHLITPPNRRTLAEILADPRYSDRAKRVVAYLDGRCWGDDKWAAWPKVATIADALGWDATDYGGRKRVERAMKELADGGDLARMTLRELVEWHAVEGASLGLAWPERLPRGMRLSLKVCVLPWRIPAAGGGLPILPRCDTGVASPAPGPTPDVASPATQASQGVTTQVSHSLLYKVRTSNGETTTDSSRPREGSADAAGSSSSSRPDGLGGAGDVAPAPARPGFDPPPLVEVLDRAMAPARAEADATPPPADGEDTGRAELIATIGELAPGPENKEVRRALYDAAHDMLKTARVGGSAEPFAHVRMAIERAASNPKRRDTIESLARGILRNWATEGFPAVVAPAPPARPKPRPDPEADRRAAVERRRRDAADEAAHRANRARWEALPEASKGAFRAEFERTVPRPPGGPLARLWEVQVREAWIWRTCLSEAV